MLKREILLRNQKSNGPNELLRNLQHICILHGFKNLHPLTMIVDLKFSILIEKIEILNLLILELEINEQKSHSFISNEPKLIILP